MAAKRGAREGGGMAGVGGGGSFEDRLAVLVAQLRVASVAARLEAVALLEELLNETTTPERWWEGMSALADHLRAVSPFAGLPLGQTAPVPEDVLAAAAVIRRAARPAASTQAIALGWADLRAANLRGADLAGADLRRCDLRGADLSGAILADADLRHALLSGANLTSADLQGARLARTDLSAANLAGCRAVEALLRETNLVGANLTRADFTRASGRSDRHSRAPQSSTDGKRTWHPGSRQRYGQPQVRLDFTGARLEGACFVEASLVGAVLEGACCRDADFTRADLRHAHLAGADLRHAVFESAFLERASLVGSDLGGADLSHADVRWTGVNDADLSGARLTQRQLDETIGEPAGLPSGLRPVPSQPIDLEARSTWATRREVRPAASAAASRRLFWQPRPGISYAPVVSEDGNWVITWDVGAGFVTLWDGDSGRALSRLRTHRLEFCTFALSGDGRLLAVAESEQPVRIYSVPRLELVATGFVGGIGALAVALSADGQTVLCGDRDGTGRLWDVRTGQPLHVLAGHDEPLCLVALDSQGALAMIGDTLGEISVWDVARGEVIWRHGGHGAAVAAASFDAQGRWLVTGGKDGTAIVWDGRTGERLRTFDRHGGSVTVVAFEADSSAAWSGENTAMLRRWDWRQGVELGRYGLHVGALPAALSATGRFALVWHGSRKLLESPGLALVDLAAAETVSHVNGNVSMVGGTISTGGGGAVMVIDGDPPRVWRLSNSSEPLTVLPEDAMAPAVSVAGDRVAAYLEGSLHIWDVATRREVGRLSLEGQGVVSPDSLALSADGRYVAGCSQMIQEACAWDIASGARVGALPWLGIRLGFASDGCHVLFEDVDRELHAWHPRTGETTCLVSSLKRNVARSALSAAGGAWLGTSEQGRVVAWTEAWREGRTLADLEGEPRAVALDDAGGAAAVATTDGELVFYDLMTGVVLRRCQLPGTPVQGLAFLGPRGLMALAEDDVLVLWDSTTGTVRGEMLSFDDGHWAVTTPDGRYDSSDAGCCPHVHWVVDGKPWPVTAFRGEAWTPGLLHQMLANERPSPTR